MEHIVDTLRTQLENQFLTGGIFLVLFTGFLALLRHVPEHLWSGIQRQIVTRVDIPDHDPAFFWLQKWLGQQPYTKRSRLLTVSTRTMPVAANKPQPESYQPYSRKRQLTEVVFSPAPGRHLLKCKGHYILLTRTRSDGVSILGEVAYHESFTFHAFSRKVVQDLILEARDAAFPPEDNRVAVLRPQYGGWKVVQRRLPRPADSVILDGDMMNDLVRDLHWFFTASDWYADLGIPYQRGYLFTGPPGAGKTSSIVAIASMFDRDIYILALTTVTDSALVGLMADLPEHALLLIEDIDRAFEARERTKDTENLTFSGFINAIDGVSAPSGRILFMTTNHPERLDPALLRPGRSDRRFEFRNASPDMARRLFLRFFPERPDLAVEFEKRMLSRVREYSMAELQEHLIKHRADPVKAVENIAHITSMRPSIAEA